MTNPNWPEGVQRGTVPPDVVAQIEDLCSQLFDSMERAGNDRKALEMAVESVLSNLQSICLKSVRLLPLSDANSLNVDLVLLTALIRVAFNNPMYDSEALTLQLKNECRQILQTAGGIPLEPD